MMSWMTLGKRLFTGIALVEIGTACFHHEEAAENETPHPQATPTQDMFRMAFDPMSTTVQGTVATGDGLYATSSACEISNTFCAGSPIAIDYGAVDLEQTTVPCLFQPAYLPRMKTNLTLLETPIFLSLGMISSPTCEWQWRTDSASPPQYSSLKGELLLSAAFEWVNSENVITQRCTLNDPLRLPIQSFGGELSHSLNLYWEAEDNAPVIFKADAFSCDQMMDDRFFPITLDLFNTLLVEAD